MSNGQFQPNELARTPEEMFLVLLMLAAGAGLVFGAVGGWDDQVLAWLLAHRVLLPAGAETVLIVPFSGGAGLDGPRLMIGGGGGIVIAAWVGDWLARAIARRHRERELV
jgi:hypothetical protein